MKTLLTTKLYPPPTRPDLLPRSRLIGRLDDGLARRLILVSAPAGFGKTTLLAQWASRSQVPVAWVSLDDGDDDLMGFLGHVAAALHRIDQRIGAGLVGSPPSTHQPRLAEMLGPLLNQIDALAVDLVLVLDDYHLVTAGPVHDALALLLSMLLPSRRLAATAVLATVAWRCFLARDIRVAGEGSWRWPSRPSLRWRRIGIEPRG